MKQNFNTTMILHSKRNHVWQHQLHTIL